MVAFDSGAVREITGASQDQLMYWERRGYVRPLRVNRRRVFSLHQLVEVWLIVQWTSLPVSIPKIMTFWMPAFRRLLNRTKGVSYRGMVLTKWWVAAPDRRTRMEAPMYMSCAEPPAKPGGRWRGGGLPEVLYLSVDKRMRWGRWSTVQFDPLVAKIEAYCAAGSLAEEDFAVPGKRDALRRALAGEEQAA